MTSASLFGASAAVAGPLDSSSARAQFLSGSLLSGIDLSAIVGIGGSSAVNDGSPADVVDADDLDLSVLGDVITVDIGGGLQIPIDVVDAGVLGQYAIAQDNGSSFAASGLVSDSGAIGVGPVPGDPPGPLRLDLSDVIGGALAAELADLELAVGAATASAEIADAGAPVSGYSIAGLELAVESAALADVSALILSAVNDIETATNALADLDVDLSPVTTATVDIDVDLTTAVDGLIGPAAVLGEGGPVEIGLGTGALTVDYAQLLGLAGLPPSTELLSSEVITLIIDEVGVLLDSLTSDVVTAVDSAVRAAEVDIFLGAVFVLGTPTVTASLSGSLQQVLDGELDAGGLAVVLEPVLNGLLGGLNPAVEAIIGPVGLLAGLGGELATVLTPVVASLDGSLGLLADALSLLVNVQESSAGVFTETALRVTLLQVLGGDGALQLDLAQAEVGPNVDLLDADPPVLTALDPISGPETGGTEVTITGTGLADATAVDFGGAAATIVSNTDTELVVTTGARAPGLVDVTVTTPGGTDVLEDAFTYTPVVDGVTTIIGVTPDEGPEDGGTEVTITGVCFTGATAVLVGDVEAASFEVVSDTVIVAVTAPGSGVVDVTVIGSVACGEDTAEDAFTFVPDVIEGPVVESLTPDDGPQTGGTMVTIVGTGFAEATSVDFGGAAALIMSATDTELIVLTSAREPGLVDVTVTTPGGSSVLEDAFTYTPVDDGTEIIGVDPDRGPESGGTVVTITGSCFTGATAVRFGSTPARSVTVVNDTTIRAVAPAGTGVVDITVVGASDCGSATDDDAFRYIRTGGSLPVTGFEGMWLAGVGGLLLLSGAVLLALRRRAA